MEYLRKICSYIVNTHHRTHVYGFRFVFYYEESHSASIEGVLKKCYILISMYIELKTKL